MTGYVADLSGKSGARAIEKLDRLRSTMAVNVLIRCPNVKFNEIPPSGSRVDTCGYANECRPHDGAHWRFSRIYENA